MTPRKIRIGDRWVGEGEPCYVIAEAGSNHNGNFEQALRLIEVAVESGADAVKFQHFKAHRLYPKSAGQTDYLKMSRPIYDIIREMEMPDDWIPLLSKHCRERKIDFLSSPFDEDSADLLESHVSAFKVASYEITHVPLLRHIARKAKPILLSTGATTLEEVAASVEVIRSEGNDQIILLQCTASYPAPQSSVNARALVTLRKALGLPTGLSDHSRDSISAPMAAVALGACVVEKHFTLSNSLPGPDHQFAVEPHELTELVRRVRQVEQVLGHGRKEVLPVETELRDFARRSIFAMRDIATGEVLTQENIAVLRCGKLGMGLAPDQFPSLLGRKTIRTIRKESHVTLEDVG